MICKKHSYYNEEPGNAAHCYPQLVFIFWKLKPMKHNRNMSKTNKKWRLKTHYKQYDYKTKILKSIY